MKTQIITKIVGNKIVKMFVTGVIVSVTGTLLGKIGKPNQKPLVEEVEDPRETEAFYDDGEEYVFEEDTPSEDSEE